jgi:predicted short-subunit dehydrogenase-like oxidoreductase (DUF2520 family)
MRKPHIAIVGAGKLAASLAGSLKNAGFVIEAVITRSNPRSLTRANVLARKIGTRARSRLSGLNAGVIWFSVPDGEIASAARDACDQLDWKGKVALHSSGALASDELAVLRKKGAAVASAHPLMTFVKGSSPLLAGVPFAIEGDPAAVRCARRVVRELGGQAFLIDKRDKAAYHAWGTFVSPLLTTLLSTAERVASIAGVKSASARQRMLPILRQTIENYATFGSAEGLSGPILRGDVETIRRHLKVLRRHPIAREVYLALARAGLAYLPVTRRKTLKRLLGSSSR